MIWLLLVLFQIKHIAADYFLQGKYMLGKFKPGWDWILPLAAHCAVHAAMTGLIIYATVKTMYWLAAVDFIVHFAMDRIKASPELLGRFKALSAQEYKFMSSAQNNEYASRMRSNTLFWWSLGLDQMVHHLTHYGIIYVLLQA